MIGWLVVAVVVAVFFTVMCALAHEALRPFDDTDQWCSAVDEDLDAMYGGWRN